MISHAFVDIPKNAETHIQTSAPGPPLTIAAADIPRADRIRKPRTSRAEAGYRTHALACGGHIAEGIFYVKFQLSLIAEAKPKGQENARTQNDDNHGCSPEHVIHHIKKIYN